MYQIIYFCTISKFNANFFEQSIQNWINLWKIDILFALLLYNRHLLSSAKYNNKHFPIKENFWTNSFKCFNVLRKKKLNWWKFVSSKWPILLCKVKMYQQPQRDSNSFKGKNVFWSEFFSDEAWDRNSTKSFISIFFGTSTHLFTRL